MKNAWYLDYVSNLPKPEVVGRCEVCFLEIVRGDGMVQFLGSSGHYVTMCSTCYDCCEAV